MSKERKITTKQMVFAAMAIALATVVATVIKLPSLPNGGSVTLFSMLLVTLVGYWYGPRVGIVAAVGFGILQFITGPYVVHPLQVVIDYPLAFGALGCSGFLAIKKKQIRQWMKEHKGFVALMDELAFEIEKGSWGPDEKFNAKFVKQMLLDNDLETDFTAGELLKVWRKG